MQRKPVKQFIRDLEDGKQVDSVFLVREREIRTKKDGAEFLKLTVADRSGAADAFVWDNVAEAKTKTEPGTPISLRGTYSVNPRYGARITARSLERLSGEDVDLRDLIETPKRSFETLETELRELESTIQNPNLRSLLERLLGLDSETWPRFRETPAAKFYHQAYRHGLLEHTLSVAQGVSAVSGCFPGIDRDLAVTGALLHDIGKTEAYEHRGHAIDQTDSGRLQGEIPLGYHLVRSAIEKIPGFPPQLAESLLHIILSHHGSLENGSPVTPATREATVVHMIDNLGGRLGTFDRLENGLSNGEIWSDWDKALAGAAFFAGCVAA